MTIEPLAAGNTVLGRLVSTDEDEHTKELTVRTLENHTFDNRFGFFKKGDRICFQ